MIIKIIGAGEDHFSEIYQPNDKEFIIGVDGGIKVLLEKNIPIDLAIGDFDSIDKEEVIAKDIITLNKIKDQSDLAFAISKAIQIDHEKIILYNVTGNRLDHFYSVINELFNYTEYNIEIINLDNKIYVSSGHFKVEKSDYKYISFFSNEDTSITLKGFKYELDKYLLTKNDNLCLSNEIIANVGEVQSDKDILIIQSK